MDLQDHMKILSEFRIPDLIRNISKTEVARLRIYRAKCSLLHKSPVFFCISVLSELLILIFDRNLTEAALMPF